MAKAAVKEAVEYNDKLAIQIQDLFIHMIVPADFLLYIHKYDKNVLTSTDVQRFKKRLDAGQIDLDINYDLLQLMKKYDGWFECILKVLEEPELKRQRLIADFQNLKRELDEELGRDQTSVKEVLPTEETENNGALERDGARLRQPPAKRNGDVTGGVTSATSAMNKLSCDDKEWYMENGRGYCNVCKLDLTSEQHKNDHISGAKHKKKLSRWNAGASSGLDTSVDDTEDLGDSRGSMDGSCNTSVHVGSGAGFTSTPNNPTGAANIQPTADTEEPFTLNADGVGFCHVCNLALTSRQHSDQHLSGKNHLRKLEARKAERDNTPKPSVQLGPGGEPYVVNERGVGKCYVCDLALTSHEHTDSHIKGRKHLKKCSDLGL